MFLSVFRSSREISRGRCHQSMVGGVATAAAHHVVLYCLHVESTFFEEGSNVLKGLMHLGEDAVPLGK